jgi:hypothetical protein
MNLSCCFHQISNSGALKRRIKAARGIIEKQGVIAGRGIKAGH